MKTVTFTEFRQQASVLFNAVEQGETIRVLRHGKAIAEVSPVRPEETTTPSWKQPGLRLSIKGKSLSQAILDERNLSK